VGGEREEEDRRAGGQAKGGRQGERGGRVQRNETQKGNLDQTRRWKKVKHLLRLSVFDRQTWEKNTFETIFTFLFVHEFRGGGWL
jgi:hypothetical protein